MCGCSEGSTKGRAAHVGLRMTEIEEARKWGCACGYFEGREQQRESCAASYGLREELRVVWLRGGVEGKSCAELKGGENGQMSCAVSKGRQNRERDAHVCSTQKKKNTQLQCTPKSHYK